MSLYPEVLQRLGNACLQYRERIIGIEEFQTVVRQAEEAVTAFEERDLRRILNRAENELELIRFAVNEARQFEESLKVVSKIEGSLGHHT